MFSKLLRRNLIAMMIPVIIILVLALFMLLQLSLLETYSFHRINNISDIDLLYREGVVNISYTSQDKLEPAGFNEKGEEGKLGSYYYTYSGNKLQMFILTEETYKKLSSGEKVDIYAGLEQDEVKSQYIEKAYADAFKRGDDTFKNAVSPIFINELKYPKLRIFIIENGKIVIGGLIIVCFLYMILGLIKPQFVFGINKKGISGSKVKLIRVLDYEMKNRLDKNEDGVYTTANFIINAYISHIDIFKRD